MISPPSTDGKIALVGFTIAILALNPPVVTAVGRSAILGGIAPLYFWYITWGVTASLVLVWAAHRDAFGLTVDQVPPELDSPEATPQTRAGDSDDSEGD